MHSSRFLLPPPLFFLDDVGVGVVVDDHDVVSLGKGDDLLVHLGGQALSGFTGCKGSVDGMASLM